MYSCFRSVLISQTQRSIYKVLEQLFNSDSLMALHFSLLIS